MDKFLPIPLGGGKNWHYYNSHEGYYVDTTKIGQREAQLRHLQEQHQHPHVYALAGKRYEEIPEDYWLRDHKAWQRSAIQLQKEEDERLNSRLAGSTGDGSRGFSQSL